MGLRTAETNRDETKGPSWAPKKAHLKTKMTMISSLCANSDQSVSTIMENFVPGENFVIDYLICLYLNRTSLFFNFFLSFFFFFACKSSARIVTCNHLQGVLIYLNWCQTSIISRHYTSTAASASDSLVQFYWKRLHLSFLNSTRDKLRFFNYLNRFLGVSGLWRKYQVYIFVFFFSKLVSQNGLFDFNSFFAWKVL